MTLGVEFTLILLFNDVSFSLVVYSFALGFGSYKFSAVQVVSDQLSLVHFNSEFLLSSVQFSYIQLS